MAYLTFIFPNTYRDSVTLMKVSATLLATPGLTWANALMATATNLETLKQKGFALTLQPDPTNVIVAIQGENLQEDALKTLVHEALEPQHASDANEKGTHLTSLMDALEASPAPNLALISVPGAYAGAEALKALARGLDVMIFSDHVSLEEEKALKDYAHARGQLVMGPDCGTAIIDGAPLGFANVVHRGNIGVIGASGTGLQEVTTLIDRLGGGISQAIGTGGRDLYEAIGGLTMLDAIDRLDADPTTDTVAIVAKPGAASVKARVLERLARVEKPVVVHFVGAQPSNVDLPSHVQLVDNLADVAHVAVTRRPLVTPKLVHYPALEHTSEHLCPSQRYLRGVFTGGTFNYEAQAVLKNAGFALSSNAPLEGVERFSAQSLSTPSGHVLWDLGDDDYTLGRPHPMIDPALRNAYLLREASREEVAMVLFDVVLGFGSDPDPLQTLVPTLKSIQALPHPPLLLTHICGTDTDPQSYATVKATLETYGVVVAQSNWEASQLASILLKTL